MEEKSRVLIVEDEVRIARFLQMELEHEGFEAETEGNGTRAYERIAVSLAEDIAAVRSGRSALRTALEKSPLMDVSSYTDNVWSAIESAWAKYGDAKQ